MRHHAEQDQGGVAGGSTREVADTRVGGGFAPADPVAREGIGDTLI